MYAFFLFVLVLSEHLQSLWTSEDSGIC